MITKAAVVNISKPVEDVFKFVATNYFTNHPVWDPRVVDLRVDTTGPVAVGTRGSEVRKQGGRNTTYAFRVTEFQPNKAIALEAVGGPAQYAAVYSVRAVSPQETALEIAFNLRMGGLFRIMEPFMASSFRAEVDSVASNIKRLMETA